MKQKRTAVFVLILFLVNTWTWTCSVVAGQPVTISWDECLKQPQQWYASSEAARIAANVLLYQKNVGGWPKNIDMATVLTAAEKESLEKQKNDGDATIDNNATYTQLRFLARVYEEQKLEEYKNAFNQGIDYLLKAQYENGGWPQYYPLKPGYYSHITYNDNAMTGVMKLLNEIAQGKILFGFVDEARRTKARTAVAKGIECFLNTQVKVNGELTVWCAQHDEKTLEPAPARKFELVSLSGSESVGIVRFLMGIQKPDKRVSDSIESAVAWFRKSQINGLRWVQKTDPSKLHGFDRVVVKDESAAPLWARFYEIGSNRPIFVGRDSVVHYQVAEIEDERRNGYQWYVTEPEVLLEKDYPAWKKKQQK